MIFYPQRIEKPWGYELIWADTEHYAGKILHIRAGEQLSLQYHEHKDETVYVLAGTMLVAVDGMTTRMVGGMSCRIHPQQRHRMTALSTCDVLEASTAQLQDVVRLADRYGRA